MGVFKAIAKLFGIGKKSPPPRREYAPADYHRTHIEAHRAEKDYYFRSNPYSPIPERVHFNGLDYYPVDFALRFSLPLEKTTESDSLVLQTTSDTEQTFHRAGTVTFEVDGQTATLAVYQAPEQEELFIPFRDATAGSETYGAGRYLEPTLDDDGLLLLDFNLAFNPFCAYSDDYTCPLPPSENWLGVPIRAGEKAYQQPRLDI